MRPSAPGRSRFASSRSRSRARPSGRSCRRPASTSAVIAGSRDGSPAQRVAQALLVAVELGAAQRRVGGAARAVDDLVGLAHERVERVNRQPDVGRQAARRPVVGRVVATVDAATVLVGGVHRALDPPVPRGENGRTGRKAHRRGESAPMRNRALYGALRDFALEAAALLTEDLRAGAEVEFDVIDQAGPPRSGPLPLQAAHEAVPRRALAAPARARHSRPRCGRARQRGRAVAARQRRGHGDQRRAGRAGPAGDARAPVRGRDQLRLPRGALRARLPRGRGHALPRRPGGARRGARCAACAIEAGPHRARRRPRARARRARRRAGRGGLARERRRRAGGAVRARARRDRGRRHLGDRGRGALHRLVSALRLWAPGGSASAAPGWRRTDEGPWQPLPFGGGAGAPAGDWFAADRRRGRPARVLRRPSSEPTRRSTWPGRWARFEMGCERGSRRRRPVRLPAGPARAAGRDQRRRRGQPGAAGRRAVRRGGPARGWCSAASRRRSRSSAS